MPAQNALLLNFTAGELSPRLAARVDLEQFNAGLRTGLNAIVLPQGGATRRSGSYYLANAANQAAASLMVPFVVSNLVAYVLEFGNHTLRVMRNRAPLLVGGTALEIATPYGAADLAALRFTQSADVLYIWHTAYQPRKLSRTAADAFSLAAVDFIDGPYSRENTGDVGQAAGTAATASATGSGSTGAGSSSGGGGTQTAGTGEPPHQAEGGP